MLARDVDHDRQSRPQRRHGRLLRLFLLLDDVYDVAARGLDVPEAFLPHDLEFRLIRLRVARPDA